MTQTFSKILPPYPQLCLQCYICIFPVPANIQFLTFCSFRYEKKISRLNAIARSFTPSLSISFLAEISCLVLRNVEAESVIFVQRALHSIYTLHSFILGGHLLCGECRHFCLLYLTCSIGKMLLGYPHHPDKIGVGDQIPTIEGYHHLLIN